MILPLRALWHRAAVATLASSRATLVTVVTMAAAFVVLVGAFTTEAGPPR